MIKLTAIALLVFGVVFSVAVYFTLGPDQALSCVIGSLMMLANLLSFYFSWRLVFLKKSVALTVLIIVFKYLILGLVLMSLTKITWLQPQGFVAGLATLVFAILSMTVTKRFAKKL